MVGRFRLEIPVEQTGVSGLILVSSGTESGVRIQESQRVSHGTFRPLEKGMSHNSTLKQKIEFQFVYRLGWCRENAAQGDPGGRVGH